MRKETIEEYEKLAASRMTQEDVQELLWEEGEQEHYRQLWDMED